MSVELAFNKELLEMSLKWAKVEYEREVARLEAAEAEVVWGPGIAWGQWGQFAWADNVGVGAVIGRLPVGEMTKADHPGIARDLATYVWSESRVSECNTSYCLAGNAVVQAGDSFVLHQNEGVGRGSYVLTSAGVVEMCGPRARQLFGIMESEGDELFNGSNTFEGLVRIASAICERRGEVLSL